MWKLEDNICEFITLAAKLLSDKPLFFFLVNSYTAGLSPMAVKYIVDEAICRKFGGTACASEVGLPVTETGGVLPCGSAVTVERMNRINTEKSKIPFIKVENLCFSYENENNEKIPVLKNVSLEIERGSFVAVLGHNGSGKSTLAKLLNMILTPDSGKIYINGTDITDPAVLNDEDG